MKHIHILCVIFIIRINTLNIDKYSLVSILILAFSLW